jgi:transcriptional regulator with XRE-family HTH domain
MNYSQKISNIKSFLSSPEFKGELVDALICTDIALDLRKLRVYQGITQTELAEKLDINQSHIARWERPGYQGYKVKMLSKIVRTLGGHLTINIDKPNSSPSYTVIIPSTDVGFVYNGSYETNTRSQLLAI